VAAAWRAGGASLSVGRGFALAVAAALARMAAFVMVFLREGDGRKRQQSERGGGGDELLHDLLLAVRRLGVAS
jgi:hypothetical protein